jgi:hypothetical protein
VILNRIGLLSVVGQLTCFLAKVTHPHQDMEIAIFRKDQAALRDYFMVGFCGK